MSLLSSCFLSALCSGPAVASSRAAAPSPSSRSIGPVYARRRNADRHRPRRVSTHLAWASPRTCTSEASSGERRARRDRVVSVGVYICYPFTAIGARARAIHLTRTDGHRWTWTTTTQRSMVG